MMKIIGILLCLIMAGLFGWAAYKVMNCKGNIVLYIVLCIIGATVVYIIMSLNGIHLYRLGMKCIAFIVSFIVVWVVKILKGD